MKRASLLASPATADDQVSMGNVRKDWSTDPLSARHAIDYLIQAACMQPTDRSFFKGLRLPDGTAEASSRPRAAQEESATICEWNDRDFEELIAKRISMGMTKASRALVMIQT